LRSLCTAAIQNVLLGVWLFSMTFCLC
jgi:hypothetical protein